MSDNLITPHGGELVDLLVDDARADELKNASRDWASWDLTERQLCDIELLMNGAFSPLTGFLGKADYEAAGIVSGEIMVHDYTSDDSCPVLEF